MADLQSLKIVMAYFQLTRLPNDVQPNLHTILQQLAVIANVQENARH
jgi:hypothetical protein